MHVGLAFKKLCTNLAVKHKERVMEAEILIIASLQRSAAEPWRDAMQKLDTKVYCIIRAHLFWFISVFNG